MRYGTYQHPLDHEIVLNQKVSVADSKVDQEIKDVDEFIAHSRRYLKGNQFQKLDRLWKLAESRLKEEELVSLASLWMGELISKDKLEFSGSIREWMDSSKNHIYSNVFTNLLSLESSKDIHVALNSLRTRKDNGGTVDAYMYSFVIIGLCKQKLIIEAITLYKSMDGVVPTMQVICPLIQYCSTNRLTSRMIYFVGELQKHNIPLDNITYTSLILGFANSDQVKKATIIYQQMKSANLPSINTSQSILLGSLPTNGQPITELLYTIYQDLGADRAASAKNYDVITRALLKIGDITRAMGVLSDMREVSMYPTTQLMNQILKMALESNFLAGIALWKILKEHTIPNIFSINILLAYCFKNKRDPTLNSVRIAEEIFSEMKNLGIEPDDTTNVILKRNSNTVKSWK